MKAAYFELEYENGIRVEVSVNGVTIWDNNASRWIVDASTIAYDSTFCIGAGLKQNWRPKGFPRNFEVSYVKPQPKKTKRRKK